MNDYISSAREWEIRLPEKGTPEKDENENLLVILVVESYLQNHAEKFTGHSMALVCIYHAYRIYSISMKMAVHYHPRAKLKLECLVIGVESDFYFIHQQKNWLNI